MNEIERLERRILGVESALILLSITAIAAADRVLAPATSLGFLYLIPLSYSALAHRGPWFVTLVASCVVLRQWDTPVATQSWARLAVDWGLLAAFVAVVVPLRRLGRARAALFRAAREQRDELVREVEMAAAVQRHLLDQHRPPAGPLDIVARTDPARVVGGDYYDFVDMGGGRVAVVVADVSGKGLPAALVMPAVKIALRALLERHRAVADMLAELNRVFLDNLPPASYFTLALAVFDPARGVLVHANAGHPPVLQLHAKGAAEWLSAEGPAVGLLHDDVRFETSERPFGPGDLFVFYTDGITEAEDSAGAEFGRERIATAVGGASGSAAAAVAAVHAASAAFRAGAPQADDATVIAVRVPVPSPGP
ncbi:MAG TPA: PP2C family protein-serine/threonine phosphatase [Vicinamibacteria bacterium]|jgi:sigma-B regulation protein RsbU (phosphoserine phosphatase)|nr:PP2C family protein-serine/threonine phosphatase [Vicinamibacteria bacterium]